MKRPIHYGFFAAMLIGFAASVGCGSGALPSLSGTVTIDGNPAPAGVALQFSPTSEGGSPSYAQTDANGNYEAQFSFNKTGIQPGEHSVKLIPGSVETPMPEIGSRGGRAKTKIPPTSKIIISLTSMKHLTPKPKNMFEDEH